MTSAETSVLLAAALLVLAVFVETGKGTIRPRAASSSWVWRCWPCSWRFCTWRSVSWRRRGDVTEAEARAALAAFHAIGDIEQWIAAQRWEAARAAGGCGASFTADERFRLEPVPGGVRVIMCGTGGAPADWILGEGG